MAAPAPEEAAAPRAPERRGGTEGADTAKPAHKRRARRPTLVSVAKQASRAGIEVARYEVLHLGLHVHFERDDPTIQRRKLLRMLLRKPFEIGQLPGFDNLLLKLTRWSTLGIAYRNHGSVPSLFRGLANELPHVRRQIIRLTQLAAGTRRLRLTLLELLHWIAIAHGLLGIGLPGIFALFLPKEPIYGCKWTAYCCTPASRLFSASICLSAEIAMRLCLPAVIAHQLRALLDQFRFRFIVSPWP
jgi:hypothetical protein